MFQQGDSVSVKIYSYAPGQDFAEGPQNVKTHKGKYLHPFVDNDGVTFHVLDTWTGAGVVHAIAENINLESGRDA